MLVGINNRDPRWHDVHLLNLKTGELKLVMKADSVAGFQADDDWSLRLAAKPNAAAAWTSSKWKATRWPRGAAQHRPGRQRHQPARLHRRRQDPVLDGLARWRHHRTVFAEDMASGQRKLIARDARADLGDYLRHPVTGEIQAYAVNYLANGGSSSTRA
ncbi:MAG: hypothetical protein U1E77_13550 [Inhella sp.]